MLQYCWKTDDGLYIYLNGATSYTEDIENKLSSLEYAMTILDDEKKYTKAFNDNVKQYLSEEEVAENYNKIQCGFDVLFKNYDDSLIDKTIVPLGKMPVFTGETPTRPSDVQFDYTFSKWSPDLKPVTGDSEYKAEYTGILRNYVICFYNDTELLEVHTLPYGTLPTYEGETPTKTPTQEIEYVFTGWTPELREVDGDEDYTAAFEEAKRKYLIKFWNNKAYSQLAQSGFTEYGETPMYTGATPYKPNDEEKHEKYIFCGWTPTIVPVTAIADYEAVFSGTPITYETLFVNNSGKESVLLQKSYFKYGDKPLYTGATPTYNGEIVIEGERFDFNGWNPVIDDDTKVKYDNIYYTVFEKKYRVRFYNENTLLETDYTSESETPIYTGSTPTKQETKAYRYVFSGWNPDLFPISGITDFYAMFDEEAKVFNIKFLNGDGSALQEDKLEYGIMPIFTGETPTKEPDHIADEYSFSDWSPTIHTVTEDQDYTPTFDIVSYKDYLVNFLHTGTVISAETLHYNDEPIVPDNITEVGKDTDNLWYEFHYTWPTTKPVTENTDYNSVVSTKVRLYEILYRSWVDNAVIKTNYVKNNQPTYYATGETIENFEEQIPGSDGAYFKWSGLWSLNTAHTGKLYKSNPSISISGYDNLPGVSNDTSFYMVDGIYRPENNFYFDVIISGLTTGLRYKVVESKTITGSTYYGDDISPKWNTSEYIADSTGTIKLSACFENSDFVNTCFKDEYVSTFKIVRDDTPSDYIELSNDGKLSILDKTQIFRPK